MSLIRELEILVDGVVAKAAYVLTDSGIIGYWPPGNLDEEALLVLRSISSPRRTAVYFIVSGSSFKYKYVGVSIKNIVVVLRVDKEIPGNDMGRMLIDFARNVDLLVELYASKGCSRPCIQDDNSISLLPTSNSNKRLDEGTA